ncbi:MAG: hypothetical protein B6I35_02955 [Anaerolineaceae bacterium 4572_32.2]|nr:MAG: hypothetical protein B6I35_02955 [Anaerolineaceae bacterium 4572_32.2]
MNGNEKQSAKANLTELGRAVTLVMALFIASRALGLARQMVIGSLFGAGSDLDAYLAAARISETVFLVITGGALGSAFIPAFAGHLAKKDHVAAWRLASATVNLALIALTVVAGLMALLAPTLVQTVIAPGFAPPQQALTASLLRLMLVSPIIFGVSGIVMGVLNAHQHFLLPALAPSVYNLSIIGGALLLGPRLGVRGIAAGVVAGAALHLLVQMPGFSAINYAWLLMMLPQGVFAQAVGTAAFPTFAAQAARGERDEMRHTLAATLRSVFALCLPATVGLLALGQPLVGLLFERGAFESSSTEAVAWALAFYALGLVGHAGLEIIARAFYALHDTFTPVWVGGLAMGLNVALSLTLPGAFGSAGLPPHAGLALANSAATLLELAALMALIRRRLDGLEGRRTLIAFAKSGLASLAMGAALIGWRVALPHAGSLAVGGGGVLLGAVVYVAAALILRMEELRAIANLARRRPG